MNHQKKWLMGLVVGFSVTGNVAAEDAFRGNATLAYAYADYDSEYIDRADMGAVSTTIFLTPVERKQHPWKEADFFERPSRLNATLGMDKTKYTEATGDGVFWSLGGTYASPNHPIVLSGSVFRSEDDNDSDDYKSKFEDTTYNAYLGSYIGKYVLIGINYSHTDFKDTVESKFSSFSNSAEVDQDDYGLSVKYLMAFRNNMAFGILARGEYGETKYEWDTEYDKTFQLTPEFYFNQKTSLQLNLAYTDYESDEYSNVYGVTFHTFLGRTFAVEASLDKYDYKSSEPGTNDSSVTLVRLAAEMWF